MLSNLKVFCPFLKICTHTGYKLETVIRPYVRLIKGQSLFDLVATRDRLSSCNPN